MRTIAILSTRTLHKYVVLVPTRQDTIAHNYWRQVEYVIEDYFKTGCLAHLFRIK